MTDTFAAAKRLGACLWPDQPSGRTWCDRSPERLVRLAPLDEDLRVILAENTRLRESDADSERWEKLARERGRFLDEAEAVTARYKAALEAAERKLTIGGTVLSAQHPARLVVSAAYDCIAAALTEEP